jgi:hypothetical protein
LPLGNRWPAGLEPQLKLRPTYIVSVGPNFSSGVRR